MKKIVILSQTTAVLTACTSKVKHNGTHVCRINGTYSEAEDRPIIRDTSVIKRTGYIKLSEKNMRPKFEVRHWRLNSTDAPVAQFAGDKVILGETIYQKLP